MVLHELFARSTRQYRMSDEDIDISQVFSKEDMPEKIVLAVHTYADSLVAVRAQKGGV